MFFEDTLVLLLYVMLDFRVKNNLVNCKLYSPTPAAAAAAAAVAVAAASATTKWPRRQRRRQQHRNSSTNSTNNNYTNLNNDNNSSNNARYNTNTHTTINIGTKPGTDTDTTTTATFENSGKLAKERRPRADAPSRKCFKKSPENPHASQRRKHASRTAETYAIRLRREHAHDRLALFVRVGVGKNPHARRVARAETVGSQAHP